MSVEIANMTIEDYDDVSALWQSVEGVGLHDYEDSREAIACYLGRNPGMSFVARLDGALVGAVLCGHDGRRGSINHLAVAPEFRKRAIGRELVGRCLSELSKAGIRKCNIVVFGENDLGREAWTKMGWNERPDLVFMQTWTSQCCGADDGGC